MKTYHLSFGLGQEQTVFIEKHCVSFSEAVLRLEYTGLDFTELSSVTAIDE